MRLAVASLGIAHAVAIQLVAFMALYPDAQAANITIVSDEVYFPNGPECTVKLTGQIVDGDLPKLQEAFAHVNNRMDMAAGYLCLDSPGGSYQEGLRIADWMLDQNVFTVIQANNVCLSACALIFMTGGDFEDGRSLERYLHPTAILGFHAPYVAGIPNRLYDKDALGTMYQLAIKSIRDLARLGQRHGTPRNFLPKALLAEMLDKGPAEAFVVDTIYKVVHLDIRMFDYRKPQLTIDGFGNACTDVAHGDGLDVSLEKPPEAWGKQTNKDVQRSANESWFAGFGAEGSEYCVVQLSDPPLSTFKISRTLFPLHHSLSPSDFHTAHAWFLFPPATLIRTTK
jgi:hypothetical protein